MPIFYFIIKKNIYEIRNKKIIHTLAIIRNRSLAITLFYFFYSSTLLSILASLFSNIAIDSMTMSSLEFFNVLSEDSKFLKEISISGYLMMYFTVLLFLLSYFIELMFKRLSSFELFIGGYTDTNTGLTNISLKYDTFTDLIKNIKEDKAPEISKKIGEDFGKILVEKYHITTLTELRGKWLETDEKAAFLEGIDFTHTDNKEILTNITIDKSFAKRVMDKQDISYNLICDFLKNYSQGVIEAYFKYNKINKTVALNVIDNMCSNCLTHNQCGFNVNLKAISQ